MTETRLAILSASFAAISSPRKAALLQTARRLEVEVRDRSTPYRTVSYTIYLTEACERWREMGAVSERIAYLPGQVLACLLCPRACGTHGATSYSAVLASR